MDLFGLQENLANRIEGLTYIPDYLTPDEEKALIANIDSEPWLNDLKRRVQHYGFKYDYRAKSITKNLGLGQMPSWACAQTKQLFERNLFSKLPDQVIVNEYEAGQGISPHIDCIPCFDKTIASISLGSACVMDFINPVTKEKASLLLEPRSLLVLTDDARYKWQHTIAPRQTDQYYGRAYSRRRRLSLTFRNMLLA